MGEKGPLRARRLDALIWLVPLFRTDERVFFFFRWSAEVTDFLLSSMITHTDRSDPVAVISSTLSQLVLGHCELAWLLASFLAFHSCLLTSQTNAQFVPQSLLCLFLFPTVKEAFSWLS